MRISAVSDGADRFPAWSMARARIRWMPSVLMAAGGSAVQPAPSTENSFWRHPEVASAVGAAWNDTRSAFVQPVVSVATTGIPGAVRSTITTPDAEPSARTEERFRTWSGLLRQSFADLGIDARIGAIPGEYCPGEYSVNAAGRIKLAGAGQRMIRGAAHVGFVILVTESGLAREVLGPVYEALDLEYDGSSVGSLEAAVAGISLDVAEEAILQRLIRQLA